MVPAANLVGTMYRGSFRLGSYFNSTQSDEHGNGKVSVEQLIKIATSVEVMTPEFTLQSAVVNDNLHSLLGASRHSTQTQASLVDENLQNFGSEIIDYVVLQNPAISITTGLPMQFTLIGEAMNNLAVYPSPNNLLLYRTFNPIWAGKQKSHLEGVGYHGTVSKSLAPPVKDVQLHAFVEQLPDKVVETGVEGTTQGPSASSVMNVLNKEFYDTKAVQSLHMSDDELHAMVEDRKPVLKMDPSTMIAMASTGLKILEDTEDLWKPALDRVTKPIMKRVDKVAKKYGSKLVDLKDDASKMVSKASNKSKLAQKAAEYANMKVKQLKKLAVEGSKNQRKKAKKILADKGLDTITSTVSN